MGARGSGVTGVASGLGRDGGQAAPGASRAPPWLVAAHGSNGGVARGREQHRRAGRVDRPDDLGSRVEPPGWTIAVTPASRQTPGPSANGKKASDAQAPPAAARPQDRPGLPDRLAAASTRLTWPGPESDGIPSRTRTMAFE